MDFVEVGDRAKYLQVLEEANEGRPERFAPFVLVSVARSMRRLAGEECGERRPWLDRLERNGSRRRIEKEGMIAQVC